MTFLKLELFGNFTELSNSLSGIVVLKKPLVA